MEDNSPATCETAHGKHTITWFACSSFSFSCSSLYLQFSLALISTQEYEVSCYYRQFSQPCCNGLIFSCNGRVSQLHVISAFVHFVKVPSDNTYESGLQ